MHTDKLSSLVIGGLVADAAALGLHWIYDPARIAEVGGEAPEFLEPDRAAYKGVPAYFAHPGKTAGDLTHYGQQLMVALESLAATGGELDPSDYEQRFIAHFGPGGAWVGYIDYATRETLRNADDAERASLAAATQFDLGEHEKDRGLMQSKVMANIRQWRGEKLARAMEKAVRITHPDDDELVRLGQAMARAVEEAGGGFHGSDDVQLPAVSKLAAVVACGADVEAAVRVTNNNDISVAGGHVVARLLQAAMDGGDWRTIAQEMADSGKPGPACPLDQSIPMMGSILVDAHSYEEGVRANILAGGDNAGRGTIIGAVLGAEYGVPDEWAEKTRAAPVAMELLDKLSS